MTPRPGLLRGSKIKNYKGSNALRVTWSPPPGFSTKLLLDDIQLNITPSEIEAIKSWIIRNYQTLMAHWCGEIDTCEAVMNLKPYDE